MTLVKFESQELNAIEESKAKQIKAVFEPMAEMLEQFEESYNEIISNSSNGIDQELTGKAKRLRLDIGKVRIETGKLKDKQKEYIKLEDKAIMGIHNIIVWAVKEKEDKLKEIENYFEIQEQKRLEALQSERVEIISPYLEDAHERNYSQMDEDVWKAFFENKKQIWKDEQEAIKKAEEERIAKEKAEAEERERIRKENERLRKEAEERERLAKIEEEKRAKAERERLAKEEAERKEREEKERKERESYEAKLKAEREAKEKIEREEKAKREKLEAELKAKEEAERKEREEEEARLQAELNKGDSAKVIDLINDLEALKTKYTFKSKKNTTMYSDVGLLIDKVINYINI
jgi:hypothetical protein